MDKTMWDFSVHTFWQPAMLRPWFDVVKCWALVTWHLQSCPCLAFSSLTLPSSNPSSPSLPNVTLRSLLRCFCLCSWDGSQIREWIQLNYTPNVQVFFSGRPVPPSISHHTQENVLRGRCSHHQPLKLVSPLRTYKCHIAVWGWNLSSPLSFYSEIISLW